MKKTELENALRKQYVETLIKALSDLGEDVGQCGSNIINLPTVDADGNDQSIEITIKVKKDEDYDCYEAREFYAFKVAEKEADAKAKAEAKAKKKAADEKKRAEKKLLKAEQKLAVEKAKAETASADATEA